MNAVSISRAIISDRWLRSFILSNYSPPLWWENDVFEVSKAGYWTEYEIKTTVADFRADGRKRRTPWRKEPVYKHELLAAKSTDGPSRFYFVLPEEIAEKVAVPEWAGLIVATKHPRYQSPRDVVLKTRQPAPKLHREKINPNIVANAKECCYYRLARNYLRVGLEIGASACPCENEDAIDEWGDIPAPEYPK